MLLLISIALLWLAALIAFAAGPRLPQTGVRGWLLALFPAASFGLILSQTIGLGKETLIYAIPWIPSLDLTVSFYFDALAALFALLVTGIGTLIIVYAGYYFANDGTAGRFFAYLFLFMGMMLGLVLAGDVLTLFIFWEGTSITSFLLVAYKYKYESARKGAFKALFITGGGGIALLAGLLFVAQLAGGSDFATILSAGETIQASQWYLVALGLVAFGAFTKSAQTPAHIWLPSAMSAPTPASAFLHSATMVKAGVYLLARMNPALGNTEAWFWLLTVVGMLTMLTGAYLGTKQDDLKALLAYSTISQLGILVMLIGQDTEIAFKALVIGIVAHAFYKSALFMLAGIVDVQQGTRSIARLGGLRRSMPFTTGLVVIAALSLAGLPPLFGFLAKETLLATAVHESLPQLVAYIMTGAVVVAAAFKLVQAGMLALDTFFGESRDPEINGKEAPLGMLFAPLLPALFSLGLGILPEPKALAEFFGAAAAVSFGADVKVSFALWTGLNPALYMSIVAISSGCILYWQRARLIGWQKRIEAPLFNRLYDGALKGIDGSAWAATRLQTGRLRFYLSIMIISMLGLVVITLNGQWPTIGSLALATDPLRQEFDIIRVLALGAAVIAAAATVVIKRDIFAVLALTAAGIAIAVYMAVEPAPDVALVQIVVDILATVVLLLALGRLGQRPQVPVQPAGRLFNYPMLVSLGAGLLVSLVTLSALTTRPRTSQVAPFFQENAKELTGASDVVGAIIVDFRALDTLLEIVVFGLAGVGIFTLLRFATAKHGDRLPFGRPGAHSIFGPSGQYLRVATRLLLPLTLLIGIIHMLYGHDQPGDGFTAGVIISLGVGLTYVVFGYREAGKQLRWLQPTAWLATGILLALLNGVLAVGFAGHFLAPLDYGAMAGIPLPASAKLSSGFIFEVAIAMAVTGSIGLMIRAFAQPAIADAPESSPAPAPQLRSEGTTLLNSGD